MKTIEVHSELIDLPLTEAQASQFAPLVHSAAHEGRNIIFMTAAPFQSDDGERIWRLQAVTLRARDAYKIVTAIRKLIDGSPSPDSNQ
jgi:hypothetical protein